MDIFTDSIASLKPRNTIQNTYKNKGKIEIINIQRKKNW